MDPTRKPRRPIGPRPQDLIGPSEEKCQQRLLSKLMELKEKHTLKLSLVPSTNEFEVLEFYGDACLYQTISQYIMTTRRFMNPHLMTQLRMSCIKNVNLAVVFDLLHLDQLLRVQGAMPVKDKADIVEAIIGELAEDEEETATLNEITAYIAYVGEKAFVHLQAEPPRPTSKNGRSLYSPPAAASAPAAPSQHAPTPHRRNDKEVPLLQPLFLLPTASQSAPAGTRPQLSAASSSDPQTSRSLEDRARTAAAVAPGRAQEATKKKKSQRGIVQTETTLNGVAYMTTQRPPLTAAAHKQPAKPANSTWIADLLVAQQDGSPIATVRPLTMADSAALRKVIVYQ